jgi:hypothetical protein
MLSQTGRRSGARFDILIYAKQVRRIVFILDRDETVVIFTIACPHAIFTLIHDEVQVCSSRRVRVQCLPIVFCPRDDAFSIRGLRIHSDDDLSPDCLTIAPAASRSWLPDGLSR